MNSTVYVFGNLSSGYTQYPEDYSKNIFQQFYNLSKSVSQIAIHREGNMMYYGYIRKLEQDKYIGLCVLLNNLMVTRFDNLFSLFENTISKMVINGLLIKFNEYGNIVPNANKLYINQEELELISEILKAGFNNQEVYSKKLPPVNYGIKKNSVGEFSFEDSADEIVKSTYDKGFTFIYKSRGYNTILINSYKGVLTKISKENDKLKTDIKKLQEKNQKILKQKKQIKKVNFLIFIVLLCGLGLYYLNEHLNSTQSQLFNANDTIKLKNDSIRGQDKIIMNLTNELSSLNCEINDLKWENKQLQSEYDEYKDKIIKVRPFLFENFSFNPYTGYLTIKYYGLKEGLIQIKILLHSSFGKMMIYETNLNVNMGTNDVDVHIGKLDNSTFNDYYFEIIYERHKIGGGKINL